MKEADIRPASLFEEYLRLSARDAHIHFQPGSGEALACPGCGGEDTRPAFDKNGFSFVECACCGTVYVSPRPPLAAFEAFYRDSDSSRFWAEVFFPAVMKARKAQIFAPRAQQIAELAAQRGIAPRTVIDVGAGWGLFLECWKNQNAQARVLAIEPSPEMGRECQAKGIEVLPKVAEDAEEWAGLADLVVSFEVMEHAHDPVRFVSSLLNLVRPGGMVVATSLCSDGLDLQILGAHSHSYFPPHHLNFMSVAGFERLFTRAGFTAVDVLTPGKLDVDIIRGLVERDPELARSNRLARTIAGLSEQAGRELQDFLVRHRLSSHAWVVAQRPM